MTIKLTFLGILLIPLLCFAQEKKPQTLPDTLVIEIKPSQKVVLIGSDLQSFQNVKVDSMIGKALYQIKDSLTISDKKNTHLDTLFHIEDITRFGVNFPLGAALIRNLMVPSLFLELEYASKRKKHYYKKDAYYSFLKLSSEIYYFYERGENKRFTEFVNSFITLSVGNKYHTDIRPDYKMKMFGAGLGYQVGKNEGGYIEKNTFKFFGFIQPAGSPVIFRSELYYKGKTTLPSISILYSFR